MDGTALKLPDFTLGIEEEYQLVNPETRELSSSIDVFLDRAEPILQDQIKPEMLQSQVEIGSHVCRSIDELRTDLTRLRRKVIEVAEDLDLAIVAASTHPFSKWTEQSVTEKERYSKHQEALADVARRMLIYGMHVHVGIEDKDLRIDVMDQARYFLPHLLALTTSSPFWYGRDTGIKSYRSIVFENLPRTGHPPEFRSWSEYERFLSIMLETGCIDEPTKIWWDIRPHPRFPTIEFRVYDVCTRVDDAIAVAALTQAIVAKLIILRMSNRSWRRYPNHLLQENKWRAVRFGLDGQLIDFGQRREVALRFLIGELLDFVDDVVEPLGIRREMDHIAVMVERGSSADRQLATYRETDDFHQVVDQLREDTKENVLP